MSKLLYPPSPNRIESLKHLKKNLQARPLHPIPRSDQVAIKPHSPATTTHPPQSRGSYAPSKNLFPPSAASSPTNQTRVPLLPKIAFTPFRHLNPVSRLLAFPQTSISPRAQAARTVGSQGTSALTPPIEAEAPQRRTSPACSTLRTLPHARPAPKTPKRVASSVLNIITLSRRCRTCFPILTGMLSTTS
jgi:hypothetical protein